MQFMIAVAEESPLNRHRQVTSLILEFSFFAEDNIKIKINKNHLLKNTTLCHA